MMKRTRITLLLAVLLSLPAEVFCVSNVGTASGVSLKMSPGARPAAMGGAFTGISDDVNAVYWNPAGLAQAKSTQMTASYIKWFADISNMSIAGVFPFGKNALGFGINRLSVDNIELREIDEDIDTLTDSSVYDMAVSLGISRKLFPGFCLGIAAKNIIQKLGPYQGSSVAFDLGALYLINDNISAGLSMLNSASGITIDSTVNKLPSVIKAGVGCRLFSGLLLVGFDVEMPSDSEMQLHAGAEVNLKNSIALRAGYDGGVTVGFGLNVPVKSSGEWGSEEEQLYTFEIDYAAVMVGKTADYGHKVSVNIKF